jgi:hypothetical protein
VLPVDVDEGQVIESPVRAHRGSVPYRIGG